MVKIFASSSSWIEGAAVQQLEQTASMPGVHTVVGMPDLHPGKGCAVGAVTYSEGIVYPHLIGNDIGCGYTLFQTTIPKHKVKPERLAGMITGIDREWDGEISDHLLEYDINWSCRQASGFGTIGGGNHFAELQQVVEISKEGNPDFDGRDTYNINPENLVLLVHSGSRSLGEEIFRSVVADCGATGLEAGTENFEKYMLMHDNAVKWAKANRVMVARRMLECLEAEGELVLDVPHNFVEPYQNGFLHRKGAAPANRGLSPLPGSRGTPTYLLKAQEENGNLASLAHGAGRKSSRANMHGRVTESAKEMAHTAIGSVVVCGDEGLMREEHQSAYKAVDRVLADLKENNLATDVAKLLPVLTYKSERTKEVKENKRSKENDWRRERHKANRK